MCCKEQDQSRKNQPTKKLNNRYQQVQRQQRSSIIEQNFNRQINSLKETQSKLMESLANTNTQKRLLLQRKQKFMNDFQNEVNSNNKNIKTMILKLSEANNINQLEQQMNQRQFLQISFSSIQIFFGNKPQQSQLHNDPNLLIQSLSQVSHLYLASQFTHRKLIFSVTFYLEFVTEIISKGYTESNDTKLKHQKNILKQIAIQLYNQFQSLISLTKDKFTKERSKILEEVQIDSSLEEMKLRNKVEQLQQRLQQLLVEKERYLGQIKILTSSTIPNLKDQLNRKELKEINQIKGSIVDVQNRFASKSFIQGLVKKMEKGNINQEITQILREKDQTIQSLKSKIVNLQKQKSLLSEQTESENKRQLLKELEAKDNQIKKARQDYNKKLLQRQGQIRKLKDQIQDYKRQIIKAPLISQATNRQYFQLQRPIIEQKRQQIQKQPKKMQKAMEEIEDLKLKLIEAELAASKAQSQKYQLQDQIKKLNNDLKKKEKINVELEKQIDRLKKEKYLLENKLTAFQLQLSEQKKLAQILQKKLDEIPKGQTRVRSVSFVKHMILFSGSLLQNRKGEKKFLMDSIERHMKMQIQKTQKLYDYKRDRATNFHKFIDGHSNLVLIVETENALISCYYSGLYEDGVQMIQEGLIVSLDGKKCYKLNNFNNYPNKDPRDQRPIRGMVYDDYYIIFGNAEVRIRSGEDTVFSNFGIANSYFNSQRDKVSSLLKQGNNNQVKFINYEIHQVFFNQQNQLQMIQ